jgi:hypothetical protein
LKSRFIHEARAAAALPRHRWSMTTTRKARRLRDREGPGPSTTGPRPIHSQTRRVPVHCGPRTSHRCLSRGHLSLIHARLNSGDTHAARLRGGRHDVPALHGTHALARGRHHVRRDCTPARQAWPRPSASAQGPSSARSAP